MSRTKGQGYKLEGAGSVREMDQIPERISADPYEDRWGQNWDDIGEESITPGRGVFSETGWRHTP